MDKHVWLCVGLATVWLCVLAVVSQPRPPAAPQCHDAHVFVTHTDINLCRKYCVQRGQYRWRRVELRSAGRTRCICDTALPVDGRVDVSAEWQDE